MAAAEVEVITVIRLEFLLMFKVVARILAAGVNCYNERKMRDAYRVNWWVS